MNASDSVQVRVGRGQTEPVLAMLFEALKKAEAKFPGWPVDPVHGTAILGEEAGEAVQAALDYYYGRVETLDALKKELAQTGAMAIRMLLFLEDQPAVVLHAPRLDEVHQKEIDVLPDRRRPRPRAPQDKP